jgi:hypothetical protein
MFSAAMVALLCTIAALVVFAHQARKGSRKSLAGLCVAMVLAVGVPLLMPSQLRWTHPGDKPLLRVEDAWGVFQLARTPDGNIRATCNRTELVFLLGTFATTYVQGMQGHIGSFLRLQHHLRQCDGCPPAGRFGVLQHRFLQRGQGALASRRRGHSATCSVRTPRSCCPRSTIRFNTCAISPLAALPTMQAVLVSLGIVAPVDPWPVFSKGLRPSDLANLIDPTLVSTDDRPLPEFSRTGDVPSWFFSND